MKIHWDGLQKNESWKLDQSILLNYKEHLFLKLRKESFVVRSYLKDSHLVLEPMDAELHLMQITDFNHSTRTPNLAKQNEVFIVLQMLECGSTAHYATKCAYFGGSQFVFDLQN